MGDSPFRNLPSVQQVLLHDDLQPTLEQCSRPLVAEAVREELTQLRTHILQTGSNGDRETLTGKVVLGVIKRVRHQFRPKMRSVINATGIVLHTNLGRSPMAEEVGQAVAEVACGYLNLELDLETGKRSSRQLAIREWVCRLTGAESATVVNNNAAATIIALRTVAAGKEVILSRGQLIEIGGSFRIPDIMSVSGAVLREVGTTNITRLSDYENAIGPNTGALLQIHTSNYRIRGFTQSVPLTDLVELGRKHNLPVIDDAGSGALLDFSRFGFEDEPDVTDSIKAGADLVLFSGDKLLGGPQAGIIAGKEMWIKKIEKDPFMRAFRLDKMALAALETTLRLYLDPDTVLDRVPVLRMLNLSLEELRSRSEHLAEQLRTIEGIQSATVQEDTSFVGGGSLPDQVLPTFIIAVKVPTERLTRLTYLLRTGTPALMCRVKEDLLLLDLRTVFPNQEPELIQVIRSSLASQQQGEEGV